jgi:hypothetical protein
VAAVPPPGFGIETISGLTVYGTIISLFCFFGNTSAAIPVSIHTFLVPGFARDRIYGDGVRRQLKDMGIKQALTSPRSPWQMPYEVVPADESLFLA